MINNQDTEDIINSYDKSPSTNLGKELREKFQDIQDNFTSSCGIGYYTDFSKHVNGNFYYLHVFLCYLWVASGKKKFLFSYVPNAEHY